MSPGSISRRSRRAVSRTTVTTALLDGDARGLRFPLAELVLPDGLGCLVLEELAAGGRAGMAQLAGLEVGAFGIDLRGQGIRSRLGRGHFRAQALLLLGALRLLRVGGRGWRGAGRGRGCRGGRG